MPLLHKFIPKNTNFGDSGACTPTFWTHNDVVWHAVQTWDFPQAKFCKNRLTAIAFGQI